MVQNPGKIALVVLGLTLLGAATLRPAAAQSGYIVTDLGTPPDTVSSYATAINSPGDVVGYAVPASGAERAVLWTRSGGMISLHPASGWTNTHATAINSLGDVVGYGTRSGGGQSALLWRHTGGMVEIAPGAIAKGINDLGIIVGSVGIYGDPIKNTGRAYAWNSETGAGMYVPYDADKKLGDLWSLANGINNHGLVVGTANDKKATGGDHHGWLTTFTAKMHSISGMGKLPDGKSVKCWWGYGVSSNDNAAGAYSLVRHFAPEYSSMRAFARIGNKTYRLEDGIFWPHSGDNISIAYAINNCGVAVGKADVSGEDYHAFISLNGAPMQDLNPLISSGEGWTLQEARGINDAGLIVGSGRHLGVGRAFLLTPRATLKSLSISPSPVAGSRQATGTVMLDSPVGMDTLVSLSTTNPAATVPACVKILAGATSQTFAISTSAVSANTGGVVSAALGSRTLDAPLVVRPIGVKSVALTPSSIKGGSNGVATATLEANAAPGNITVTFTSSLPDLVTFEPVSKAVPFKTAKVGVTYKTKAVMADTLVTVTATANGISANATLKIRVR